MPERTHPRPRRLWALALAFSGCAGPVPDAPKQELPPLEADARPINSSFEAVEITDATALILVVAGQSNAAGVSGGDGSGGGRAAITTTESSQDFVLDSHARRLCPLREGTPCHPDRESPASGFVARLRAQLNPERAPLVVVRCAQGGSNIEAWEPAGDCTQRCLSKLEKAVELLRTEHNTSTLAVAGVYWSQGEANIGIRKPKGLSYQRRLMKLSDIFFEHARRLTGQKQAPAILVETPSTFTVSGVKPDAESASVVPEQVRACDAHPSIICLGPTYAFVGESMAPWLHRINREHRRSGEMAGWVLGQLIKDQPFSAVRPQRARATGTKLEVCFSVPTPPLVIDTRGCPAHPDGGAGLEVSDEQGRVRLTEVKLQSSQCVSARLDRALGPNAELRVAWTGAGPTKAFGCRGSNANAYSNLRDSTPSPGPFWALHDRRAIEVVD